MSKVRKRGKFKSFKINQLVVFCLNSTHCLISFFTRLLLSFPKNYFRDHSGRA